MSSSRDRILETASRLVRERGAGVTMAEVARESGVSRQMVYLHFETKAGLFTAVTRWHDARTGLIERMTQAATLAPLDALEALMRAWLEYVPEVLPVARQLHAAAVTGADGGEAWDQRMDELRRAFRYAARRVELREPWTPETAADWIWSRTHLTVYDQLVVTRGWPAKEFADRTIASVLGEVTRSPGR